MIGQGSSFTVTSTLFLAFTTSILAFPAFELNARGDTSNTNITISDKKVNWGDGYPPDIIEHIREACYDSGSCDETPIKIPITLVDDAGDQTEQDHIVLTPHGTYDGANRDAFVDALKAAASKGWKKDEDKWAHGSAGFGIGVEDGTVDHYTYTEYLSITRIGDGKDGTESMGVSVTSLSTLPSKANASVPGHRSF